MTDDDDAPKYPAPPEKYPPNIGLRRAPLDKKEAWITLADAMEHDLTYGGNDTHEFICDARYAPTLSFAGGDDRRTPLYNAVYNLSNDKKLNLRSASGIAQRLETILEEIELTYGKKLVAEVGNTICFSHALDHGKRSYTETLRDLLEENNKIAPFFAPVIERFQLLPHSEVIQETLPHSEKVKAKDLREMKPFR